MRNTYTVTYENAKWQRRKSKTKQEKEKGNREKIILLSMDCFPYPDSKVAAANAIDKEI